MTVYTVMKIRPPEGGEAGGRTPVLQVVVVGPLAIEHASSE